MRKQLSVKYIRGSGIEIGALHCPTAVADGVRVTYVDRDPDEVRNSHQDVSIALKDWVVDDATVLANFQVHTQDFVIANHVLEHLTNPIKAIVTWFHVLKPGGIIFFSLPDKDFCFDRNRSITTFEHLLADWKFPAPERDFEHYLDWYMNSELEGKRFDVALPEARAAYAKGANIHFHVWNAAAMRDFVRKLLVLAPDLELLEDVVNGGEVIFILRKKVSA